MQWKLTAALQIINAYHIYHVFYTSVLQVSIQHKTCKNASYHKTCYVKRFRFYISLIPVGSIPAWPTHAANLVFFCLRFVGRFIPVLRFGFHTSLIWLEMRDIILKVRKIRKWQMEKSVRTTIKYRAIDYNLRQMIPILCLLLLVINKG